MKNTDAAFQRVRAGHVDGLEVDQLLTAFWSGYPLQKLRELLNSENPEVVAIATWILWELSDKGAPLLDKCRDLLSHSHSNTRFFVLDTILVNATPERADLIAGALQLLDDDNAGVRWKALDFASRLSRAELEAVCRFKMPYRYQSHLEWLLQVDLDPERKEVIARLQSDDFQERRFGAIAAARMAHIDAEPMNIARQSQDENIRGVASDFPA